MLIFVESPPNYASVDPLTYAMVTGIKSITVASTSHFLQKYYPQFWQKHYEVSWVYDGKMPYSFFIPLKRFEPDYLWWDTGTLLTGSGLVYRKRLPQQAYGQNWFVGLYSYYDVMVNVQSELTSLALDYVADPNKRQHMHQTVLYKRLYPLRWSLGGELGLFDCGLLTVTGYGMLPPDVRPDCTIRMKGGVSARLSINLYPRLKPFMCGSISYVERKISLTKREFSWSGLAGEQAFQSEKINSVALGVRWTMKSSCDMEIKYFIYNQKGYHMPIHLGCRINYNRIGCQNAQPAFLYQPPERYIPDYSSAFRVLYPSIFKKLG